MIFYSLMTNAWSLAASILNGTLVESKGRQLSQYPSSCAGFLQPIIEHGCLTRRNWVIACKCSSQYCFAYFDWPRINFLPQPVAIHFRSPLVFFLAILNSPSKLASRPDNGRISRPCWVINTHLWVVSW